MSDASRSCSNFSYNFLPKIMIATKENPSMILRGELRFSINYFNREKHRLKNLCLALDNFFPKSKDNLFPESNHAAAHNHSDNPTMPSSSKCNRFCDKHNEDDFHESNSNANDSTIEWHDSAHSGNNCDKYDDENYDDHDDDNCENCNNFDGNHYDNDNCDHNDSNDHYDQNWQNKIDEQETIFLRRPTSLINFHYSLCSRASRVTHFCASLISWINRLWQMIEKKKLEIFYFSSCFWW